MKHARTVVGLMSLALVLALSVVLQGQKAGKPPNTTTTRPIPLKVTFYAVDDFGTTAVRGHGGTTVTYVDRTTGVDAYISRDGDLWFHLDCNATQLIDVAFDDAHKISDGADGVPPYNDGDMTIFRMMTSGLTGRMDFRTLQAGTYLHPLGMQFWTPVDGYAWNFRYDNDSGDHQFSHSLVNLTVEVEGDRIVRWTLMPRYPPNVQPYAFVHFEKYVHERPQPGYYLDYGNWTMPFKIVLEPLQ